jgi:hypothetical protein
MHSKSIGHYKHLEKVAYIASVGYSGSTLLDMILGSQQEITALGEVALLSRYSKENAYCTCGERIKNCRFWNNVENELKSVYGDNFSLDNFELSPEKVKQTIFRKLPTITDLSLVIGNSTIWKLAYTFHHHSRLFRLASLNALDIYEIACKIDQSNIIIDSSKYAIPLKSIYMEIKNKLRVIYLVRDGRAVCKSLMNRQGLTIEQAAKKWARYNQNINLVNMSIPQSQIYHLTYERLCLDTDSVLSDLTSFLGTKEPIKLKPLIKEFFHDIGGNPMRYRRAETAIKYNDDWKSNITNNELEVFERLAGKLNRKLGYT